MKHTNGETKRTTNVLTHIEPMAIGNTGLTFVITKFQGDDGQKIGELVVSRAGLRWKPGRHQSWKRVTWSEFELWMRDKGYAGVTGRRIKHRKVKS